MEHAFYVIFNTKFPHSFYLITILHTIWREQGHKYGCADTRAHEQKAHQSIDFRRPAIYTRQGAAYLTGARTGP
jgi:hypothetical protein